ncbi:MAG: hypothetical protein ABI091_14745, partial [Ferruginibacter sp.]
GTANNVIATTNIAQSQLTITITLNGNAPSIIPYSQKIHGGSFTQPLPMVQVMFKNYAYYHAIKLLKITSMTLESEVDALKNISLQNDDGKIDTSKPFKFFGEFPDTGASFTIGSKEAFQKPLTSLEINMNNINFPDSSIQPINITCAILSEKNWNPINFISSGSDVPSFNITASNLDTASISIQSKSLIPEPDFTPDIPYTSASNNGFVKLLVTQPDFNLSSYISRVQSASATNSVTITGNPPTTFKLNAPSTPTPVPPSPTVDSVYLSYNAMVSFLDATQNTEQDFESRLDFFYHIEPFGFREIHPYLLAIPVTLNTSLRDNMLHVLPVFNLDNDASGDPSDNGSTSAPDNEGELWIGLSGTKPGETHSILFQVSEGSSNPLKDVASITWYYMVSNNWILFDDTNIIDQTNNLSQSGLVIFNMPGDETNNNTRADNGLLWLKAVVIKNTDSVCKIIAVQTNAARAQFVTDLVNEIYFRKNIDANIISKPAIADAALKQTSQPYPSNGGTPKESEQQFDQRVSERLRHKHRSVTAWDYERLILQNFPDIHKVKCLNHTKLKTKTQDYSEMKPGDVMIVAVPDFSLVAGANPLLPFTNVGLLDDIKKFIKPLCSPFVHVQVCNPQFEAVQFGFNVSIANNNSNISYYSQQLDSDIQQFLMPWAFGSSAADIEFGGKIEKSVVMNFVQSRPYVDFVTCFTMAQYIYNEDGTFKLFNSNLEEAMATSARSILVPYKDPKSVLGTLNNNIYSPANCNCNA